MNTFDELCKGRYFVIPENQRGFSWEPSHADDIFEDLLLAGTHAHYMGPIIVTRTRTPDFQDDDLNTTVEFTLEDGQQRLTTFFLIANEIRKLLEAINRGPDIESKDLERLLFYNRNGRQLRLQNTNADLQQHFSNLLIGSPAPPAVRTPPMNALQRVKQHIATKLSTNGLPVLIAWKRRITNKAKFIWVDLASESVNRYLTFDAINSRGLPLSEFDKIKNFCILVDSVRQLPVRPEQEWYGSIAELESFGVSSRASEAAFITELYAAFYNERVPQAEIHSSFVRKYRKLLTEPDDQLQAELVDFIRIWKPMSRSFGFIANGRDRPRHYGTLCTSEAGKWLTRLDNMDLPTITRILLTASHLSLSPAQFEIIARACEIYTFRVYAVVRYRKDKYAAHITALAHEVLRQGADDARVLRTICSWLHALAPMDAVIQELGDGEAKYYYDRRIRGWAHCYYLLYEYEVGYSPSGVGPLPWESGDTGRYNTQEHILPQQHRDNGWWEAQWPDEAEADRFKHRLGNLVLTPNNPALGRKSIDRKINDPTAPHSYTHPNATNTEKRIRNFTSGSEWKAANILRREFEMLNFAAQRWGIPCCADNGVITLPPDFAETSPDLEQIAVEENNCIGSLPDEAVEEDDDDNDSSPQI